MIDPEREFYRSLGAEIKRRRGRMTQGQLAAAIDLPRTSIVLIERGEQRVQAFSLVRLAQVLGTTVEELMSLKVTPIRALDESTPPAVREWITSIASAPVVNRKRDRP